VGLQVGELGLEIRHLEEIVELIMTCTKDVDELDQIIANHTLYLSRHANTMIE
jgi:hypothetical protein